MIVFSYASCSWTIIVSRFTMAYTSSSLYLLLLLFSVFLHSSIVIFTARLGAIVRCCGYFAAVLSPCLLLLCRRLSIGGRVNANLSILLLWWHCNLLSFLVRFKYTIVFSFFATDDEKSLQKRATCSVALEILQFA